MGDRANVLIKDHGSSVYLYTHWSGTELPQTVAKALARNERWDDGQYLARIIFCEMVKGQESEPTGYGISSVCGDGDDRIVTVDVDTQYVILSNRHWPFNKFSGEAAHWPDD